MLDLQEQLRIIKKGVAEIISEEELVDRLKRSINENRPLRLKLGMDPTAPDIHLGHSVVLRKLRQFQDLGHEVILIIGDFTALIGDPTGRSETRKQLSKEEILANAETYKKQAFKILRPDRTIIRNNGEWLSKLSFEEIIKLTSKYTVARMLEREDFKNRFTNNIPICLHEFLYPLMQGYDSVAIQCDIEFGGTDQKFNLLMGRYLQKEYGQEPQIAILMPILEGTDGVRKMSKSYGNYIGVMESPDEMYGKVMSIPDEMIIRYYELVTDVHPDEIDKIKNEMERGELHPRDAKMSLAKEIVKLYHGTEEAEKAEQRFISIFQKKDIPDDIPTAIISENEVKDGIWIAKLLTITGLSPSNSEARRIICQGGVRINGNRVDDENLQIVPKDGDIIQYGKRKFVKIKILN